MKNLIYTVVIIITGIGIHYAGVQFGLQTPSIEQDQRDPASARKPARAVQCKYLANDLKKEIIGFGPNIHAARADASSKCFDVRTHAADTRASSDQDFYDRGLINIDECVNIRCS